MHCSNHGTHRLVVALGAALACAAVLLGPASHAQTPPAPTAPAQPADGVPFTFGLDVTLGLNADKKGELIETRRIKVLGVTAVQQVAQQNAQYVEGMQSFEIVAAFTEKANGSKVPVDPATVITRDGATGLASVFARDLKIVTVIFPDVAVGDTLVLTTRRIIRSDTFAGHFEQMIPLPRVVPYADSTLRVIAPSSLPLKVGVQGEGMEHSVTVANNERRHVIVYRARPVVPGEDRMTSPLDRDPAVFVSTFANYEELARSYWAPARAAIEVTPEIAKLADEITRGIDDKRAQAKAISNWVKSNIRYIFVALGTTRVVPHNASEVIKNRYGDCKDHAVLMSALLAVKGIASEHVLINGGNAYTLPEPATMGYLNHVILYLPELEVYDDPTARFASFGVLGDVEYDKPVVHVSDRHAYLAHTPAMKPEDHISDRRTRYSVAADGTVSGETEQLGTGLFATNARTIAASLQSNGLERSAQGFLPRAGTPGRGRFEIGPLTELNDAYSVRAQFTYDERVTIKPPKSLNVPTGLGIQVRPGDFVLAARNPARKLPFVCLAGKQIEETEVTFAEGLPLPQKVDNRHIETKSFTYDASYSLENRTFKARRQFLSRVPGQVCPPELEAELAQPMRNVYASMNTTQMTFLAPPAPQPGQPPAAPTTVETQEVKRNAVLDQPLQVDSILSLNPDCTPIGEINIRTIEEPKHGKLTISKGSGFSNFLQDNPRQVCNRRRSEAMLLRYLPESGYLGADSITVDIIYPEGYSRKRHYAISVNPKPMPTELTRAAATEQQIRVGFLTNVDPDCTSNAFASVRILEQPKHGEATLKQDTGFTNFPKENLRFECNKQRSDGTAVLYRSEVGFMGRDAVLVEIVYTDGRESSIRYWIDVK
jgi:transglutaminase-like putative cysteine protease